MGDAYYGIRVAASRTGLSQDLIRAWEKRYQAVQPSRTGTRRRMYGESDLKRLQLLRLLTEAGHPIGDIAGLPDSRLESLFQIRPGCTPSVSPFHKVPNSQSNLGDPKAARLSVLLSQAMNAVTGLDPFELETALTEALVEYGRLGFLTRFVARIAWGIGERWRAGELTVAHEHFASAAIRVFLGRIQVPHPPLSTAPLILTTTPAGQLHELGAVMVHFTAQDLGWRSVFLGSNLAAAEIASVARQHQARAVALSIVYPADDPALGPELITLRRLLPRPIEILVGGRAAAGYLEALRKADAAVLESLEEINERLDRIRSGRLFPEGDRA